MYMLSFEIFFYTKSMSYLITRKMYYIFQWTIRRMLDNIGPFVLKTNQTNMHAYTFIYIFSVHVLAKMSCTVARKTDY